MTAQRIRHLLPLIVVLCAGCDYALCRASWARACSSDDECVLRERCWKLEAIRSDRQSQCPEENATTDHRCPKVSPPDGIRAECRKGRCDVKDIPFDQVTF